MSGSMTRHLYNNICSFNKQDGTPLRYLEIGCWKGSSTTSALHSNNVHCTVIDNWSEFEGPKDEFMRNIAPYMGENLQILEEDSFTTDIVSRLAFAPYDVYMYDGHHSEKAHEQAITHFWDALAPSAVIIVDDWEWEAVRNGTFSGFSKVGANIVDYIDLRSPTCQHSVGAAGFWNGCGIFRISK